MPYATLAFVLLALKLFAATCGARLLCRLSPDRLAAWLAAWVILQAFLIVVMILASAAHTLGAATVWGAVVIAAVAACWVGRRATPLGVLDIARQGGMAPWLFAALVAALAIRASIFSDFSWDAQTHGVVRNAVWMNYHSILVHMPTIYVKIFTDEWNGELAVLTYGLVSGNLQGLMFGNIEIFVVCYITLCWLALRFGAPPRWAAIVGLVAVTVPVCLGLVGTVKNDFLAFGALAMTVGWLTALNTPYRATAAAMLPTCAALAFGAKVITLPLLLIIGVAALVQAIRSWQGARFFVPIALGAIGGGVFLARFALNAIVYGNPLQRIDAERPVIGWSTFVGNIEPITHQMLWFGVHAPGTPLYSWLLFGGLGLAGFFSLFVLAVQWSEGIAPTRERLLILAAAVTATLVTACLIPWADWTFRYYAPTVLVGAVAILAFPFDRLTQWLRASVIALALLTVVIDAAWFTRPGEANGNHSLEDAIKATLHATPLDRALLAQQWITDNFRKNLPDFDRDTPLTFAVFQNIDAPISPIVGSRAQNRLVFAADIEGLARLTQSLHPDFVVIAEHGHNPMNQETRELFSSLGYSWLSDGQLAAIAERRRDAQPQ